MHYFIASPRKLFLSDALGAMVTVTITVGVLVRWTQFVGMPAQVLYKMAIAGSVFAVYSFVCFVFVRRRFSACLRIIALANLSYCAVTVALCVVYRGQITAWGWAYFIGECLVLVALAGVEMRVAAALNKDR